MNFTRLTFTVFLAGIALACGNPATHEHQEAETSTIAREHNTNDQETSSKIKLRLNNGAKWAADESTFTGMQRLQLAIDNFTKDNPSPAIEDYHQLGVALAKINADIIGQCSMQGEDHEQLHLLLAPMLKNVDVLKNTNNMEAAAKNFAELAAATGRFFDHFEIK